MHTFWDRVKILIGASSVVEMAKILQVKRSTLSSWVQTDRKPPYDVLKKIMRETGLGIEELDKSFSWDDYEEVAENVDLKRKNIINQIDGLGENELEVIQSFLHYVQKENPRKPNQE